MSEQTLRAVLAAYICAGVLAWGHFISLGCMAQSGMGDVCSSPPVRVVPGVGVAIFWPVYASALLFDKGDKP